MTTIAYHRGEMACDSAWNVNGTFVTSMTKIDRLSSGALLGAAGDSDIRDLIRLLNPVRTADRLPGRFELAALRCNVHAILVLKNGDVYQIGIHPPDEDDPNWSAEIYPVNKGGAAVGSGSEIAIGAMDAGRSAAEAVRIACGRDTQSRLPVHVVPLRVPPTQKRRSK